MYTLLSFNYYTEWLYFIIYITDCDYQQPQETSYVAIMTRLITSFMMIILVYENGINLVG